MTTDPIADMLTRIRNAPARAAPRVEMPLSKLKVRIAEILKEEGYIAEFSVQTETPGHAHRPAQVRPRQASAIVGMRRLSRPGRRVYVKHTDLPQVMSGMGISIISTSRGVLTNRQAENERVGGELLCEVW